MCSDGILYCAPNVLCLLLHGYPVKLRLEGPESYWLGVKWPMGKRRRGCGVSPLSFILFLSVFSSPHPQLDTLFTGCGMAEMKHERTAHISKTNHIVKIFLCITIKLLSGVLFFLPLAYILSKNKNVIYLEAMSACNYATLLSRTYNYVFTVQ